MCVRAFEPEKGGVRRVRDAEPVCMRVRKHARQHHEHHDIIPEPVRPAVPVGHAKLQGHPVNPKVHFLLLRHCTN